MPSALIYVMTQAAERAGRNLVRDFGEVEHLQVSKKGPRDFVSRSDRNSERTILEYLQKARPDWGFLMEESGQQGNQEYRFIVDPLDGTTNFLHAVPHFCISIAAQEKGQITAGVIFDPIKDELFSAEIGHGAFLNQRRLRVSTRQNLLDSLLAVYLPIVTRSSNEQVKQKALTQMSELMNCCAGIRHLGSSALDLAYVAAGRLDGFWEKGLSIWDIAAGAIIVQEAGGHVVHANGSKVEHITTDMAELLASNDNLHSSLLQTLQRIDKG